MRIQTYLISLLLTLLTLLTLPSALAQVSAPANQVKRQDPAEIQQLVHDTLLNQAASLGGRVEVKVNSLDPRLSLSACAGMETFAPAGSRAWGKTTLGVRCSSPTVWTIYVQAQVQVWTDYVAAAGPLLQGQTLRSSDLIKVNGDLGTLPAGVLTDPSLAVGQIVAQSIPLGTPIRRDSLRTQQVVQQGQIVRVVSSGSGFKISTEGRAIANASEGQMAQARTLNGQLVSGIARAGGLVEVAY